MQKNLPRNVHDSIKEHLHQKHWRCVVTALACVVVFCTTYALIIPAVTMTEETYCGKEAHTHTQEECYKRVLVCGQEETEPTEPTLEHTHTDECYETKSVLICHLEETVGHTHDEDCRDEDGNPICGQEETQGHTHDENCYEEEISLICESDEKELTEITLEHTHTDECYETKSVLVCDLEENVGHTHGEDCRDEDGNPICGQEETQGHTHDENCYEEEISLICESEEAENTEIILGHTHTDECYEERIVCLCEEHEHTLICYSDPEADVESAAVWERTLPQNLGDNRAENAAAVAISQLGYAESTANYIVADDGVTIKGYTRYGEWYGDPYGDWSAMFVSFCLNYAGIPTEAVPYEASCPVWIEKLEQTNMYADAEEYTPRIGDIIFFDYDPDGTADHVGLVEGIETDSDGIVVSVTVIEGDSSDIVKRNTYDISDVGIMGYGILPEKPAVTITATAADGTVVTITGAIPDDAQVEISPIYLSEDELDKYLDETAETACAYDIKIIVDGEEWQPTDPVSVSLTMPGFSLSEGETLVVSHVDGDTDTASEVPAIITDESDITFEASGFSTWIISVVTETNEISEINETVGDRFTAVWDGNAVSQVIAGFTSTDKGKNYSLEYNLNDGAGWMTIAWAKSQKGEPITLKADISLDEDLLCDNVKFRVCSDKSVVRSATLTELLDGIKPGFGDWVKNAYTSVYGGTTPTTVRELYTAFAKYMELATVIISAEENDDGVYTGTADVTPEGEYTYRWQYLDDNEQWQEFGTTNTDTINLSEVGVLQSGPHRIRCSIYTDDSSEPYGTSNVLKFNPKEEEYAQAIEDINRILNLGSLAINGTQFNDYFYYGNVAKDSRVPFNNAESYADYLAKLYLDEGIEAVDTAWRKYLYDIYDPSHDKGTMSNEKEGYPGEDGATYGDQNLGWPKDNASSFHTTGTPEIDPLNYDYFEQGIDYGNFVTALNKEATAVSAGDENTDREYLIDITADAQAKAVGPVAIILQIQTSWQMFDLEHANALQNEGATEVGAVANNTELATLYDIKQALLRFVDYIETKYPGNNLVLGITETQHAKSKSMFVGSDRKGNGLYVSNNYDILRNSILEWDTFGNCEHVHYDSDQLQNAVANLAWNLADLKYDNGESVPYDDIRKVAVVIGGPTENTAGGNGYVCTLPWDTFTGCGIDSVYGIRTNNGTSYAPTGELSWLDYSGNTSGTTYSEGRGTAFTKKYIATTEDKVYQYLVQIAEQEMGKKGIDIDAPEAYVEDVTVTDTIRKEFSLNENEPITATITNKDGSVAKTLTLTKNDLNFTENEDGTTTVTYNFGKALNGQKCTLHFGIVAEDDYIGSNNVYTNVKTPTLTYKHNVLGKDGTETGESRIYDVGCTDTPQVNVPIRYNTVDGEKTTVLVNTEVDLKDLGSEIPKQVEELLDNYSQINGTLTYVWEMPDGSSVNIGSVTVNNGVPSALPDISEIFTPTQAGSYVGTLKLTFTPESVSPDNNNFSDETTKTAVNALEKSGKVWVEAVEEGTNSELIVRKVWEKTSDRDKPEVKFRLLADGADTGETYTLNEDNNWETRIDGLETVKIDGSGNAQVIKYTVEETEVPDGYKVSYSEDTETTESYAAKAEFTITCSENKNDVRTVSITCYTEDGRQFTEEYPLDSGFVKNTPYTFEMGGMPLDEDGNPIEITSWEFTAWKSDGSIEKIDSKKVNRSFVQSRYKSGSTSIPVLIITNTADSYELPETGGHGTTLFTLGGLCLMTLASALMYRYFKRCKWERRFM